MRHRHLEPKERGTVSPISSTLLPYVATSSLGSTIFSSSVESKEKENPSLICMSDLTLSADRVLVEQLCRISLQPAPPTTAIYTLWPS
jgi:hypothetical protein